MPKSTLETEIEAILTPDPGREIYDIRDELLMAFREAIRRAKPQENNGDDSFSAGVDTYESNLLAEAGTPETEKEVSDAQVWVDTKPKRTRKAKIIVSPETEKECTCIINPDTEEDHNCDANGCSSVNHYRRGCMCSNSWRIGHFKNDCPHCQTEKEEGA